MLTSFDPSVLVVAAITALGGFAFSELRKPAKRQEQWLMMALAGLGAYAFRQFEGRGAEQGQHSNIIAAVNEQVRTLFETTRRHDARLNAHADDMSELRAEVRAVTTSVSDMVKRMDKYLEAVAPPRRGR